MQSKTERASELNWLTELTQNRFHSTYKSRIWRLIFPMSMLKVYLPFSNGIIITLWQAHYLSHFTCLRFSLNLLYSMLIQPVLKKSLPVKK